MIGPCANEHKWWFTWEVAPTLLNRLVATNSVHFNCCADQVQILNQFYQHRGQTQKNKITTNDQLFI